MLSSQSIYTWFYFYCGFLINIFMAVSQPWLGSIYTYTCLMRVTTWFSFNSILFICGYDFISNQIIYMIPAQLQFFVDMYMDHPYCICGSMLIYMYALLISNAFHHENTWILLLSWSSLISVHGFSSCHDLAWSVRMQLPYGFNWINTLGICSGYGLPWSVCMFFAFVMLFMIFIYLFWPCNDMNLLIYIHVLLSWPIHVFTINPSLIGTYMLCLKHIYCDSTHMLHLINTPLVLYSS